MSTEEEPQQPSIFGMLVSRFFECLHFAIMIVVAVAVFLISGSYWAGFVSMMGCTFCAMAISISVAARQQELKRLRRTDG